MTLPRVHLPVLLVITSTWVQSYECYDAECFTVIGQFIFETDHVFYTIIKKTIVSERPFNYVVTNPPLTHSISFRVIPWLWLNSADSLEQSQLPVGAMQGANLSDFSTNERCLPSSWARKLELQNRKSLSPRATIVLLESPSQSHMTYPEADG
jgi:hypothetical protein